MESSAARSGAATTTATATATATASETTGWTPRGRLPLELVQFVVDELSAQQARGTLASLAATSGPMHALVLPVLYRRLVLTRANAERVLGLPRCPCPPGASTADAEDEEAYDPRCPRWHDALASNVGAHLARLEADEVYSQRFALPVDLAPTGAETDDELCRPCSPRSPGSRLNPGFAFTTHLVLAQWPQSHLVRSVCAHAHPSILFPNVSHFSISARAVARCPKLHEASGPDDVSAFLTTLARAEDVCVAMPGSEAASTTGRTEWVLGCLMRKDYAPRSVTVHLGRHSPPGEVSGGYVAPAPRVEGVFQLAGAFGWFPRPSGAGGASGASGAGASRTSKASKASKGSSSPNPTLSAPELHSYLTATPTQETRVTETGGEEGDEEATARVTLLYPASTPYARDDIQSWVYATSPSPRRTIALSLRTACTALLSAEQSLLEFEDGWNEVDVWATDVGSWAFSPSDSDPQLLATLERAQAYASALTRRAARLRKSLDEPPDAGSVEEAESALSAAHGALKTATAALDATDAKTARLELSRLREERHAAAVAVGMASRALKAAHAEGERRRSIRQHDAGLRYVLTELHAAEDAAGRARDAFEKDRREKRSKRLEGIDVPKGRISFRATGCAVCGSETAGRRTLRQIVDEAWRGPAPEIRSADSTM